MEGNLGQECPVASGRDDRKSAAFAKHRITAPKGSTIVQSFAEMREIFRSPNALQGMDGADAFGPGDNPDHMPVFFLDGESHRRRRGAIARYFTPKSITTRYREVIHRTSDALMTGLRKDGSAILDIISFQMAVDVTAEVVGLTNSNSRQQARRLRRMLSGDLISRRFLPTRVLGKLMLALQMQNFYQKDVAPAIAERRRAPREDVISHMIHENYSKKAILVECMVYGTAGMITTRELITMAAWHMLDDDSLKQRFIDGDEDDQFAIIEEILRLEPVAGMLYREVRDGDAKPDGGVDGTDRVLYSLDIRAANLDETVTGPCPYALDPDRAKRMKMTGDYMSFGYGPHRCPGAQLALHETRVFLDKMLRLPGIRLAKEPRFSWKSSIMGYELRDAVVTCDRL